MNFCHCVGERVPREVVLEHGYRRLVRKPTLEKDDNCSELVWWVVQDFQK